MKNKKKIPPLKELTRDGEIIWTNEKDKWIKHIPFKIKGVVINDPPEGGVEVTKKDLEKLINTINEKFEKQSAQIGSIRTEFNKKFEKQSAQIGSIRTEFNKKFEKQSTQIDSIKTEFNEKIDGINQRLDTQSNRLDNLETKIDKQSNRLDKLETKIDDLTLIVKKNHPEDFLDKN